MKSSGIYEHYIDAEIKKGRSEEDVLGGLGDPGRCCKDHYGYSRERATGYMRTKEKAKIRPPEELCSGGFFQICLTRLVLHGSGFLLLF